MSHTKDTDEHQPSPAADAADLVLVDLLYGELDGDERRQAEQRVREDDALAGELEALSRIRAIMRELPDEEPPEALSTKLLHAAAAEVAHGRAAAAGEDAERPSVWAWLRRLFMPVMMHPGLAAAASVILVGGVAGMLYLSGRLEVASPMVQQEAALAVSAAAPAAADSATTGAPLPEGVASAGAPAADSAGVVGGALEVTEDVTSGERESERSRGAATRRPARKADVALKLGDFGAEEQRQEYFAQAPAEEPVPSGARMRKAGRAASDDDAERAGLVAANARARRSRDQAKKQEASPRPVQPGARDQVALDELASAEGGSGAGPRGTAPAARSSAAEPPAVAATPPAKAPARKPTPAPSAAPPPPADRAPEAAAEAEEADVAQAGAPATGKAATKSKKGEQKDTAARVGELHKRAQAAASRGDCAAVRTASSTIQSLDPTYHRNRFARDERLQECMGGKSAVKK